MTPLPALTGKILVTALAKAGFNVVRIRGSHNFCGTRTAAAPLSLFMPVKP